ncbi:MAG: Abi family protein [Alphaproteobacteria bacterium]|nr:Abi family protein [Alphaproteobacteria bacterium]
MTDFLIEKLSKERWATYEKLSNTNQIAANELYKRNLIYSKELYVILSGVEVVIRNTFHNNLAHKYQREDWLSLCMRNGVFLKHHKKQIDTAIEKLTRNKRGNYTIPDLISELSFGFWVHLVNRPYEKTFWVPVLSKAFPKKLGPPVRQDIESRLKTILKLRNKIAHLEPIIKNEPQLIQAYQNAHDLISWICPKTANWFDGANNFKEFWQKNNRE